MFCVRCGGSIPADAPTCGACGLRVGTSRRPRGVIVAALTLVTLAGTTGGLAAAWIVLDSKASSSQSSTHVTGPSSAVQEPPSDTATDTSQDPNPDFSQVFTRVSTGIVPVTAVVCGGTGLGTAFLIDEQTLVTAAHVVTGAVSVSVQVDGTPHVAEVAGIDESIDLATLRISGDASAAALQFSDAEPVVGDAVAALGYPSGTALRLTEGSVLSLDEPANVEGEVRRDLLESNASSRKGNSGGPLIDPAGDVVGVVIAGRKDATRSLAVQSSDVQPMLSSMPPPSPHSCDEPPLGPDDRSAAGLPDASELTEAVAETFGAYFGGINSGAYAMAYDQFSPRLASPRGFDAFAAGVSTSYDFGFDVRDADFSPHRVSV